jgi:hypothetical protein
MNQLDHDGQQGASADDDQAGGIRCQTPSVPGDCEQACVRIKKTQPTKLLTMALSGF